MCATSPLVIIGKKRGINRVGSLSLREGDANSL
jgi:hypothetical protein